MAHSYLGHGAHAPHVKHMRSTCKHRCRRYGAVVAVAAVKAQVPGCSKPPGTPLPSQNGTAAQKHTAASSRAKAQVRARHMQNPSISAEQQLSADKVQGTNLTSDRAGNGSVQPRPGKSRAQAKAKKKRRMPVREFFDLDDDDDDYEPDRQLAPAEWGGFAGVPTALGPVPSQQLVRAQDKNRLKPAQRAELARRLRREAPELGVLTGHMRVVRLYRFALDDLRLFKAIHQAGIEGRVVVVDDPQQAHVVVSSRRTRTGRDVPADNARNLATKLGVPFVQLEKVSGYTLMDALCPILGIPMPEHLLLPRTPPLPILPANIPTASLSQQVTQMLLGAPPPPPTPAQMPPGHKDGKSKRTRQGQRTQHEEDGWLIDESIHAVPEQQPAGQGVALETHNTWVESGVPNTRGVNTSGLQHGVAPDGVTIGALLRGAGRQQGPGPASKVPDQLQPAGAVDGATLQQAVPAQVASLLQQQHRNVTALQQPSAPQASLTNSAEGIVLQSEHQQHFQLLQPLQPALADLDVEDQRRALLPLNPTARIGAKYKLVRPIRHCARVKLKAALKRAAEQNAAW